PPQSRFVATDPRKVAARPCRFPGRPRHHTGAVRKKIQNRDSPGAQISDDSIAAARAGPAEGLLISLRLRLDDPEGSAMAWPLAETRSVAGTFDVLTELSGRAPHARRLRPHTAKEQP